MTIRLTDKADIFVNNHSSLMQHLIFPDWPAPSSIKAASTTRLGGVSKTPFDSLNMGYHSGDDDNSVMLNRQRLTNALDLPDEPVWLKQVHGNRAIDISDTNISLPIEADAAFTRQTDQVCAIMTADCLPVLLCNQQGTEIAAIHAGWRGLARGVIPSTIDKLHARADNLMAWLGPAIGPQVYEVGHEVREAFVTIAPENSEHFQPSPAGRWLADLQALARAQLHTLGVSAVYADTSCTLTDSARFFSYRRDGSSGRMASLIWITKSS